MSLTFGTLLILFFLIPGLVFRKSFFILPFDKRYAEGNTISEIALILITSVLVQWLGLFIVEHTYDCWYTECGDVYAFFREYIFSDPKKGNCRLLYDNIDLEQFVLYQLSLWGLAVMLGFFFNSLVRYFRLDRKYRILRFGNSWYYYFSGEAIEFPDIGGNSHDIDYIFVDVLVRAEGKELIYIGILSEYELSPNGGLKSIALKGAKRRELETDSNRKATRTEEEILKEYYTIPSNLLVIPYNDSIVNINFRYYADDESDKGRSDNVNALERIVQVLSLAIVLIYVILAVLWIGRLFSSKKQQPADDPANKPSDPSEHPPES